MRSLRKKEKDFLIALFGLSLNVEIIVLKRTLRRRPWSPYGNRISLPGRFFKNSDEGEELRLLDPYTLSVFAHEALHVWQRQHGRWVTAAALLLHLGAILHIRNPYEYDSSIMDPILLVKEFVTGSVERQGQIFQDSVYDLQQGKDTSRYRAVWSFVRKAGAM